MHCSCSRCEAAFPSDAGSTGNTVLAVSARLEPETTTPVSSVVLASDGPMPQAAAADLAGFAIGMDDPTLEPKIHGAARPPVTSPAPLTYSSVAEEETWEPVEEPEESAESGETLSQAVKDPRPGFFAFMVVTGLPTAMAAGAWQLSTRFGEDPLIWTTPAGVLGLLFSWLWVRWKYRER